MKNLWIMALLVGACWTAQVGAQDTVFNAMEQLEGFEERFASEFSDLYDLERFETIDGKSIPPARLEEVRKEWIAHRDRADAQVAKIKADPDLMAIHTIELALQRHVFFSKITYRKNVDHEPFVLFIERPRRDSPNYYQYIAQKYGPWLQRVTRLFEERFAKPLHLVRRKGFGRFAVVILASRGSYVDYAWATGASDRISVRAHYESPSRLAITFEDVFSRRSGKEREELRAITHEVVHMLQHAYSVPTPDQGPKVLWFLEGLANHLSMAASRGPESMTGSVLDVRALEELADVLVSPEGVLLLNTLPDLVSMEGPGYGAVIRNMAARGVAPNDEVSERALRLFYAQSTLLTYFLDRDGSPYREGYGRYVDAVTKGGHGWATFVEAMKPHDPARIEAEFLAFVRKECCSRFDFPAPSRWPELVEVPEGASLRTTARGSAAGTETPAAFAFDLPAFQVKSLAFRDEEADAILGAALIQASDGNLGVAIDLLSDRDDPLLAREAERLRDLSKLRRSVFDILLSTRRIVRLRSGGETLQGRVVDVRRDSFVFRVMRENKTIPFAAVPLKDLLSAASMVKVPDSWRLDHLRLLCGRSLRRKKDAAAIPAAARLVEDAPRMRAAIEKGVPAATLLRLIRLYPVPTPDAAEQCVRLIERLVVEFANNDLVASRRENLESCCKILLDRIYRNSPNMAPELNGEVTMAGDGRVRIVYEFDELEELKDFDEERYLEKLGAPPPGKDAVARAEGGALSLQGYTCLVHRLSFAAPLTIRYTLTLEAALEENEGMYLGLCDDGRGNGIYCNDVGGLVVFDGTERVDEAGSPGRVTVQPNHPYTFEITHDGKGNVRVTRDGEPLGRLTQAVRSTGRILLWINVAKAIRIDRVEIEGKLAPGQGAMLEGDWIRARLKDVGF